MEQTSQRRFWVGFVLLAAVAATLRVAACGGELWLDEVMSYRTAESLASARAIVKHSVGQNSHGVTVLWMHLVGDTPRWWVYRLPSLLAGCLLIPLAALPLRRQAGGPAALAAVALFGTSFFMLTYSSEARGYAGVMLHALLAFRLAERQERSPGAAVDWALGACLVAGALWQPVFVLVWGAFALWVVAAPIPRASAVRTMALPCAAVSAALLMGFRVHSAMAVSEHRLEVLWRFLTAGFALTGPAAVQSVAAAALAVAFAASFLRRPAFESRSIAILRFALCAIPVAGVLAAPTHSIFPRYFAAALPTIYLSVLYGSLPSKAAPGRPQVWAGRVLGLLLLAANVAADVSFLRDGRGHVLDALQWMAERSPREPAVRWISDHPHRNGMLVDFYARYIPDTRFERVSHTDMGDRPAPWALIHQIEDDEYSAPPQEIAVEPHGYRFVRTFTKFGLSGFRWHLYSLIPPLREPSQDGKRP